MMKDNIVDWIVYTFIGAVVAVLIAAVVIEAGRDYGQCLATGWQHYSNPIYSTMCTGSGSSYSCTQYLIGFDEGEQQVCTQYEYPNGDGPKSKKWKIG
jgi:hypothetical protein